MSASVTWIGHASALIELGGERVLVDPLGRRRCRSLPEYQAILITHAHVDHLNRWTLKKLDKEATLFVPRGATRYVADLGFARVQEVRPGDHVSAGGLDILGVPTRHDNGRWRKSDHVGCTGYIVEKHGHAVHHAGDVDMSEYELFAEIGRECAIDASLLPIGGLLPVWYYRMRRNSRDKGVHIDPDTALHIAELLRTTHMIPVHWGTVNLRLGPPSMPRRRLQKIASENGSAELIQVLSHGDALELGGQPLGRSEEQTAALGQAVGGLGNAAQVDPQHADNAEQRDRNPDD